MSSHKTISELNAAQIEAINEFIKSHNLAPFTMPEIELLAKLEEVDVLGMADCCATIKGYFADLSDCSFLDKNGNGETLHEIMQEYKADLNEEDYEPSDLAQLVADKEAETKAEIAAHGIILYTNKDAEADVLFLNEEFAPIFIEYVRF